MQPLLIRRSLVRIQPGPLRSRGNRRGPVGEAREADRARGSSRAVDHQLADATLLVPLDHESAVVETVRVQEATHAGPAAQPPSGWPPARSASETAPPAAGSRSSRRLGETERRGPHCKVASQGVVPGVLLQERVLQDVVEPALQVERGVRKNRLSTPDAVAREPAGGLARPVERRCE
jgi:hypothetical protein